MRPDITRRRESPCQYCEARQIGCHGWCAAYKEYKQFLEQKTAMIRRESVGHYAMMDGIMRTKTTSRHQRPGSWKKIDRTK